MNKAFVKRILVLLVIMIGIVLISGCDTGSTRIVTFNSDGGSDVVSQTVDYGTKASKPDDPIKEGFKFIDWYLNDVPFNFDKTNITKNITLKAKWENENAIAYYTVKFIDYDNSELSVQSIAEGESATAPTDPTREGYEFVGWDKAYSNITEDTVVTAEYEEEGLVIYYIVKFIDYDGSELSVQSIAEGRNATAPTNPTREGYSFTGWDKGYSNITEDVIITAEYEEINYDTEYDIIYNLCEGSWWYESKNECIEAFLVDFYNFVNASESLNNFIHGSGKTSGFDGEWKNYVGGYFSSGTNHLLYNNDLDADNNDYFFNSSSYKAKWNSFGKWIASQNNRFNGNSYSYGILDFYRYIINDHAGYINIYGEKFYGYPECDIDIINSYKYSNDDIILPIPTNKNTLNGALTFLGWYSNSDFTGAPITMIPAKSTGDLEIYANWGVVVTYQVYFNSVGGNNIDAITVEYGDSVTLPIPTRLNYEFKGWYYNQQLVTSPLIFEYNTSISLIANWKATTITNIDFVYDGATVKYRNNQVVQIPSAYANKDEEFRAVWVTSFVSDFSPSTNQATMKNNLTNVLNTLESYNMNAIIFHVRTTNNAYYQTNLAPIASNYGTYNSFDEWDYLEWFIEECHKRDIQFHAWMNPYRIKTYGYSLTATPSDVAQEFSSYPLNPAYDASNILMTYYQGTSQGAILNPCKQAVKDYVVDVCLEFMEKYNCDAIHFDDYFYAQMSSNIAVLTEPDQNDYIDYINKNPGCGYSKTSESNKQQWRRDQVDDFIYQLSTEMRKFNKTNNRHVQLGISPTGIYRNGNGVVTYDSNNTAITTGSNTGGQEHWKSYLFSDSKKWVDNEWIDYIIPQTYWGFTHSTAGYADVIDWWAKVVKYKDVNLYSGMGLYMSESGKNYSWGAQEYEASNQILYNTKLPEVKGTCIFSYKSIISHQSSSAFAYEGLKRIKNEYWTTKVSVPKTMADN